MTKKSKQVKKDIEDQDLTMKESEVEIGKVAFTFMLTRDEADAYLKKPKGQIARNLRKYMHSILEEACKRFNAPIVTDCKEEEKEA